MTEDGRVDHDSKKTRTAGVALFILLASLYAVVAGGHPYSSDEEGLFLTTQAIVEHRAPFLSISPDNDRVVPVRIGRDGRVVSVGGLGQSVVAVPLYVAGSVFGRGIHGQTYRDVPEWLFVGWTNALITAAGAVLVFLFAVELGATRRRAIFLSLVYGLCTFVFPHAKTFFSEPLCATASLAGLYWAVRSRASSFLRLALSGAAFGVALFARSTAALFVPVAVIYLIYIATHSRRLGEACVAVVRTGAAFAVGLLPLIGLLLLSNWWRFGSLTDFGYQQVTLSYPIKDGLYGLFLSPGKSVFLYAPVVAVGLAAAPFAPRGRRAEVWAAAAIGLINALFFARFRFWHGDHTWGPRYLIMSVPFWVVAAAPLLGRAAWRRAVVAAAAVGAVSAALGVVMYFNEYFAIVEHSLGATILPDGPSYWKAMHYKPYWSPIAGHARALPLVVRNTVSRLDGHADVQPFPPTTNGRYGWYFAPPQADAWAYWLFPTHGPKRFVVFVLPQLAGVALGARRLTRATRSG